MKNIERKTRTKIENLEPAQGSAGRKELGADQLRLITGGLMMLEPCSCTNCGDVDCD